MPELPEVETVRRSLAPLVGRRIEGVEVRSPRLVRYPELADFLMGVTGRTIAALGRRGKYLLLRLDTGQDLMVHLRMTGRLIHQAADDPIEPHTHVVFTLDDGSHLRFQDVRTFGGFYLLEPERPENEGSAPDGGEAVLRKTTGRPGAPPGFLRLGPEPLTEAFTVDYLRRVVKNRRGSLKPLLLNQDLIAGLGNIYADEALFRSGLHPDRRPSSLKLAEVRRLHQAINQVVEEAIALRGTSFSDYVDGQGNRGRNVENLRVYGREGSPCLVCGTPVKRILLAGRSSHYCPACQPAPRRRSVRGPKPRRREQ